jgi:hypothetical protein
MKKSRFTENQIVSILKEAMPGLLYYYFLLPLRVPR